jgi:DNA processing protein
MRTVRAGRNRSRVPAHILETTLGVLLLGRRSLERAGQQTLGGDPFVDAARPLWISGDPTLVQHRAVAIVGTRNATETGTRRARKLARELSTQGVVIVSGLARGIDEAALTEAIAVGGRVIAVIGTPVDRAYPIANASLQETIADHHLLVSQFAPGTRTRPSHFPERNRLMAALSDATAIIEAGDTSGTLHQATECLRLDRWLFIAQSVMQDATLTWPARFKDYRRTVILTTTGDIDRALTT